MTSSGCAWLRSMAHTRLAMAIQGPGIARHLNARIVSFACLRALEGPVAMWVNRDIGFPVGIGLASDRVQTLADIRFTWPTVDDDLQLLTSIAISSFACFRSPTCTSLRSCRVKHYNGLMRNAVFYLTYNGLYNFTNGIGTQTQLLLGGMEMMQETWWRNTGRSIYIDLPPARRAHLGIRSSFL